MPNLDFEKEQMGGDLVDLIGLGFIVGETKGLDKEENVVGRSSGNRVRILVGLIDGW